MFFSEGTFRDAILLAVQQRHGDDSIKSAVTEAVDALIDADRKLRAYDEEINRPTS